MTFTLGAAVLFGFFYTEPLKVFERLVRDHPKAAPFFFVGAKIVSVLIPPVPSAALGLAGIHFFGWRIALLYDFVGNMGGAVVAFFVARKFRAAFALHFGFVQKMNSWIDEHLPGRMGFRSFLLIRIFTEGIFDFISYSAGLTRIRFSAYFLATILGCLPMKFLVFYLGGAALRTSNFVTAAFVLLLTAGAMLLQKSGAYDRVIDMALPARGND